MAPPSLLISSVLALSFANVFVNAVQYGFNHVPIRRDSPAVEANFQDPQNVTLLSPAFTAQDTILPGFTNGTQGPTSDADMDSFLRSLAEQNDWMTYHSADFLTEEGKSVPYVSLSASTAAEQNSTGKLRVWLQGAVHGNEPAGDASLLSLLGALAANQSYASSLLASMDIMVLPRYNPDGVAYFQRTLATNFDPNRDHIKLARQYTRDIKRLFNQFAPHVSVDMHEYGASTIYGGSYVHASDGLFSAAKNLNIDASIRNISEELFAANVGHDLEAQGFRWEPYVTGASNRTEGSAIKFAEAGSDAKIGRNAMGLTQTVTFLCETRGIGIADQEFTRRTAAALAMVSSILQTAADNSELVYRTVEDGIEQFSSSTDDLVITDYSDTSNRTFQMIDIRNGTLVDAPITFSSTTPVIANLTRSRPQAYLIPRAWADLASRLTDSGVEVVTLDSVFQGTAETYNVTSISFSSEYYEGVLPVTATTEVLEREIELPAGSFRISTAQKNAALAVVALEPENIDSYVSFNILPADVGDELPVYRIA